MGLGRRLPTDTLLRALPRHLPGWAHPPGPAASRMPALPARLPAARSPSFPLKVNRPVLANAEATEKQKGVNTVPGGPASPLPRGAFHLCGSSSTHSNEGPSPSSAPPHPVPSLRLYSHGHLLPGPARMLISHRGRLRFQEAQCPRGCTWRSPSVLPGLPDPPAHLSATTELSRCV